MKTSRTPQYPILDCILNRWSPRAFSGEKLSDTELMTIFEAARWAQSSYNGQPWRFIYARNGSAQWQTFVNLMVPFNQSWASKADTLIVVASRKLFEYNGNPSRTHSFDTGAACQNMAVQGASMNIVVHGMEGFDYDRAKKELNIPDEYDVEAMFAVGKLGKKETLSPELQERETPSDRKPIGYFASEGAFKIK